MLETNSTLSLHDGLTVQLGEHSYIHDQTIRNPSGALTQVTIGKFCSIATDLTVIGYDHHHEWITTYPFLDDALRACWPGTEGIPYPQAPEFGSNKSRGDITIGNDVWIGYNVKLFKGVTIGNGAVIGACSLVNKSIEPYTIVAGTPARPIRKRFTDAEIAVLQRICWWDWSSELINQYMPFLCGSKISDLEKRLEQDPAFRELKAGLSTNGHSTNHKQNGNRHVSLTAATPKPATLSIETLSSNGANHSPASSEPAPQTKSEVRHLAQKVGDDWKNQPYYDDAEQYMEKQWRESIWPFIREADFSNVVDLAAGHGRNSEKLKQHAGKIHIVDINQENIDYCRKRFANDPQFTFTRNDGCSLDFIPTGSVSLLYCFDAMVHFDSDVVRAYLKEFKRILQPGGIGFCHHSNYTRNPGENVHDSPGWRNFMSEALFTHYCRKEGLIVIKSRVIDWELPGSDCLTLFRKEGKSSPTVQNGWHSKAAAPELPAPAKEKKPARVSSPDIFNTVTATAPRPTAPLPIVFAPINRTLPTAEKAPAPVQPSAALQQFHDNATDYFSDVVPPQLSDFHLRNSRIVPTRDHILPLMPKGGVCAEVGTQTGGFAKLIYSILRPSKLHIYDIDYRVFDHAHFASAIESGRVELHEGDSSTLLGTLPDRHFDFIYIDGDHSYNGIVKDLAQAARKIKHDGWIVCNDYTIYSPLEKTKYGVYRAVNELCLQQGFEIAYLGLHQWGYHDVALKRRQA